jgi:hypothetical protein
MIDRLLIKQCGFDFGIHSATKASEGGRESTELG